MKKIKTLMVALACLSVTSAWAQRPMDKLDRGIVATTAINGVGNFISWRRFGEEYYDTKYNLYADGVLLAQNLSVQNFVHASGNISTKYQVAPVVRGVEGEKSAVATHWNSETYSFTGNTQAYIDVPASPVVDRRGNDVTGSYQLNDVSLADVDGDGISEFIVKRKCLSVNENCYHHTECYDIKGNRLWWIDMGPNLPGAPDEQYDVVAYDWDQDGKAEVLLRGSDNMIIHMADGSVYNVGDMTKNYNPTNYEYCDNGAEYLLYLEGATGRPYWTPIDYPLPRFEQGESDYAAVWGKGDGGHRASKHYFGAPFLDGRKPYIFLGRGCYTRHKMVAFSVDPTTHALTKYWRWNCYDSSSPWFGQGYHNFAIADVDMDGRDEIVFGSMVIDDNGKGLSTTGLGHGDAQHCTDLDPYKWGLEQFACNEDRPDNNYRNATTSEFYFRQLGTADDGRALAGNFSNRIPGSIAQSSHSGVIGLTACKILDGWGGFDQNSRIYWDGDLCEEILNSPGTEKAPKIDKYDSGRIFLGSGNMNNWSKNNPGAVGDIFGDWREELVIRSGDALRIYTTNYPTNYGIYTLWHDHQYRNAMVWQCMGYNQPPHPSFFLGELEGITVAPPPLTMTGRTEVANNGTIRTTDAHLIVCENNDTRINVEDGASPYIVTFNVPSWVQGNDNNNNITYKYYTCEVSGGAFTGATRVIKQGEGVLTLPTVVERYSGETNVWGGTLNFDGTLESSPLWLNRFTTLNTNGGMFLAGVKADYASTINIGDGATVGGMITTDLKLGFGSRIVFDLNNDLTSDNVSANKMTIETKDWQYGPKYSQPVFEFANHGDTLAEGDYVLGNISAIEGSVSDIKVEGLPVTKSSKLVYEGGKLLLRVSGIRKAASIAWTAKNTGVWDFAQSENFALAKDSSTTIFVSGDNVEFGDNASVTDVKLSGDLVADTVCVNSSKDYTFSGSGTLTGTTTLVKKGSGTLTINNDNTYTGGTRISGGTVKVGVLSNPTTAYGNLGAVTSDYNKFIIENGGKLQTTADVTLGSGLRVQGTEGGVIVNSKGFTVNKTVIGTKLTKQAGGTLTFLANNTSLDELDIQSGVVHNLGATVPAKKVTLGGGVISESGSTSYPIEVKEGTSSTWNLVNNSNYSNKITGAGNLNIYCPVVVGSGWYATRTPIACNFTEFSGTITAHVFETADGRFSLSSAGGMPNGTLEIPSGVIVQNEGKTFAIGKLAGKGTLGGTCAFRNGTTIPANTWNVGGADDFSWEGIFTSSDVFNKVGTGKMTVSGAWTNTSTVNINGGGIEIAATSSLGTGALNIANGGTLYGVGTLKNSMTTVNSGATVTPGITTAYIKAGAMQFGGSLNVKQGANVNLSYQTAVKIRQTSLEVTSGLSMNGTVNVIRDVNSRRDEVAGDSLILWTAATFRGTPTFNLPELPEGLKWDTSDACAAKGILRVVDASTGVKEISANEQVEVSVFSLSGSKVATFTCNYSEAISKAYALNLHGTFILNIKGNTVAVKKKLAM